MSAAYPWIRNSGTISGAPTGKIAITSTSGLYFSTATNSSILSFSGADLTIESAGTGGDIILKTNGNNRLTISDAGLATFGSSVTITDGVLTVNNTTGGGLLDPVLVLNQTVNAILYEERVNNKTGASGDGLYRISFKGRKSTGTSTFEYGYISLLYDDVTSSVPIGKMNIGINSSLTPVITLKNTNTDTPTGIRADFNNNNLTSIKTAQTNSLNYLTPQTANFISSNVSLSFNPESVTNGQRIIYSNNGTSPVFSPINNTFPVGTGPVYCTETHNGVIYAGTDNYLLYTTNSGSTWKVVNDPGNGQPYTFNGSITCLKSSGSSYLYIGGEFTTATSDPQNIYQMNYVARFDNSYILQMGWNGLASDIGFNGPVYTIEAVGGYIYYGGTFNGTSGGAYSVQNFIISDESSSPNLYQLGGNSGSGFNNTVRFIKFDSSSSTNFIIGGNFNTFFEPTGGSPNSYYCIVLSINGTTYGNIVQSYSFNNACIVCQQVSSTDFYVGGNFNSTGFGDYLVVINNSSGYTLYPIFSGYTTPPGPVNLIYKSTSSSADLYWTTISPYNVYKNGQLLGINSPSALWTCIQYLSGATGGSDCFSQLSSSTNFYYYSGNSLSISIGGYTVVNNGIEYSGTSITLPNKGNSIELAYNTDDSKLYVISNNGATGIGGGGGGSISNITAGSGISVTNGTGPTTTINNTGVVSFTGGTNTTVSNLGGGTWQVNASGGGGSGLQWSDFYDNYTTYSNMSSNSSYNNTYSLGMNSAQYYVNSTTSSTAISLQINNSEYEYLNPITNYFSYAPYVKVGQWGPGNAGNFYTLLSSGDNESENTTLATINNNMHLYANKRAGVSSQGLGNMYLYANYILPGNGDNTTFLGTSSSPTSGSPQAWKEVVSYIFNNISDKKFKKDIKSLDTEYCLNLIEKTNPVSYIYNNDDLEKTHFGVIAQDIENIIGDENIALYTNDNDNRSISYTEFIAPLIKTVQHLLQKVEDLESQIKELKNYN